MLEKEIVEFSKYRAPVQIMEDMVERFTNLHEDGKLQDLLDRADNDKKLIESKRQFYETESELLRKVFSLYIVLREYSELSLDLTDDKIEELRDFLKDSKDIYEKIHNNVYNIHIFVGDNESDFIPFFRVKLNKNKADQDIKNYESDLKNSIIKDMILEENGDLYADKTKYDKLIDDFDKKLDETLKLAVGISNILENISTNKPGSKGGDINEIYWWSEAIAAYPLNIKLMDVVTELRDLYIKMQLAGNLKFKEDATTSKENHKKGLDRFNDIYDLYLGDKITDTVYDEKTKLLENISIKRQNDVISSNQTIKYKSKQYTYDEILSTLQKQISDSYSRLKMMDEKLNIVLYGQSKYKNKRGEKVPSLDELLKLVEDYRNKFDNWEKKAQTTKSELAGEDLKEIADRKEEEFIQYVTKENVEEFKTRVKNIKKSIEKIMKDIDSYKYNNKKIKDIPNYQEFIKTITDNLSGVEKTNSAIKKHAKEKFKSFKEADKLFKVKDITNKDNHPLMNPKEDKVNVPKLYKFFHKALEKAYDEKDTVDDQLDEFDSAKDEEKELKEKEQEESSGISTIPINKTYSDNTSYNNLDIFSGLMGQLKNIIGADFKEIRDDIFATTYAMNMFSYATYDNEGKFNLASEDEQKTFTLPPNYGNQEYYWERFDIMTQKGTQDARRIRFKNRTMTGERINKDNNQAFPAEIEYILQGTTDNKKNVDSTYFDIFQIRYGLNMVSSVQHFWGTKNTTGQIINGIAANVAAISQGFIPVPLTKLLLLSILTAAETSYDMRRLKAGFPVEIYKFEEDDWIYKIDINAGLTAAINKIKGSDPQPKENKIKGLFYSDYLTLFLLSYISSNPDQVYKRIAEIIQTNIGARTGKGSNYLLSNSQVFYKLNAKVKVDPILFTLNLFKDYVDGQPIRKDWNTYDLEIVRGY